MHSCSSCVIRRQVLVKALDDSAATLVSLMQKELNATFQLHGHQICAKQETVQVQADDCTFQRKTQAYTVSLGIHTTAHHLTEAERMLFRYTRHGRTDRQRAALLCACQTLRKRLPHWTGRRQAAHDTLKFYNGMVKLRSAWVSLVLQAAATEDLAYLAYMKSLLVVTISLATKFAQIWRGLEAYDMRANDKAIIRAACEGSASRAFSDAA